MAYQYFNPYYQQQMPVQQPVQQQQIQTSGFIPVPSEEMARNYPVAPGNSVTFKNENAPYVYTKTMGFSQLDRPIFEKYKLVKEDAPVSEKSEQIETNYNSMIENTNEKINSLNEEILRLWDEINTLKKPSKKKESD